MKEEDGNLPKGCFWGALIAIPIWISIFGWMKIFKHILFS